MKKMKKKILSNILLIPSVLMLASTAVSSCSKQSSWDDTFELTLFSRVQCLKLGSSTRIWAIIEPYYVRYWDLTWEIIKTPDNKISVDDGLINVPTDVTINKVEELTIKATVNSRPDVIKTITLFIVPNSQTSDFVGFWNNEIQSFNTEYKIEKQKIVQKDDFTYETESYINCFVGFGSIKPVGFTSIFNFTSICMGDSWQEMTFKIKDNKLKRHGISWSNYVDGDITTSIPDIEVWDPTALSESIEVHFIADPRVTFTIKLALWQDPEHQTNTGVMMYSPDKSNPHRLVDEGQGVYTSEVFLPSFDRQKKQLGYMKSIYCSRQKYEYSDFIFKFTKDPETENEIYGAFSFFTQTHVETRPVDHFRYYLLDFSYMFDTNKISHTAEYWHYQTFPMLDVHIYDRLYPDRLVCSWTLWLKWI